MKPTEDRNNNKLRREARSNRAESAATCGLLLVLVAMMLPFFGNFIGVPLAWAKWVYAAGALLYTAARAVNSNIEGESLRLRRLRRMEFWAGMCFIVGGAFWFYQEQHFSGIPVGPLAILRQTVAFTMAGAVIQIVASWMISFRQKKEASNN
ncbi:MAG: hypothetical protein K2K93_02025 [Muribaculaceae bacterium]|nr:hypothetical protein [Muribaculaceae bacterium]